MSDPDWSRVSSIENGTWLCASHADLIDTNAGRAFSPEILLSYKRIHEERIAREQTGISRTFGWLQELVVERGPILAPDGRLILGKVTILQGASGTGKTALCDWISGAADPFTMHRWWRGARPTTELRYLVRYYAPEEKTLQVEVTQDSIRFHDKNAALALVSPMPFKVITLREPHLQGGDSRREGEDDLALLSRLLHIDSSVVWNALLALNRLGTGRVRNADLREDDGSEGSSLYLDVEGTKPGLAYLALSDGERARVHLEIVIVVATMAAQYFPTVLLLDGWIRNLPGDELIRYEGLLSGTDRPFQSVMVHWDLRKYRDRCPSAEYVQLVASDVGSRIEQELGGLRPRS